MSSHGWSSSRSSSIYCGHEVTSSPSNLNTHLSWSPPRCCCGRKATVYMSKTEANPDKEFFGCPNFKRSQPNHCSYFLWLDEFFETRNHIENQQRKIMHLERDLGDMKRAIVELEAKMNKMQVKVQVKRQGFSKG